MGKYFLEISKIPRCSGNEAGVREYIKEFAIDKKLEYKIDKTGNIYIKKPASKGYETAPGVILQGHLDMVCEKTPDYQHDFSIDPLSLFVKDGWLKAKNTTLGADNGIAIAYSLLVLEDENIQHPEVEAIFTIDEETGLVGAAGLEEDLLKGKVFLNLDSEEEGIFYIGCAGGRHAEGKVNLKYTEVSKEYKAFNLIFSGFVGGHSGTNIQDNIGNAIHIGSRFLCNIKKDIPIKIGELSGGGKHNVIPREFKTSIFIPKNQINDFISQAELFESIVKTEFPDNPNIKVSLNEATDIPRKSIEDEQLSLLLNMLYSMPFGVTRMSKVIPGIVETSTNLAAVSIKDNVFNILTSQRSSFDSALEDISGRVKACMENGALSVEFSSGYSSWSPKSDSKIVPFCSDIYTKKFNKKPEVTIVHAGLECGVISDKYPNMEMISFGPDILGAHSPDERINISSAERVWEYLVFLLENMNDLNL